MAKATYQCPMKCEGDKRYMPCKAHGDIKSQIEGDEGKAKSHLKEGGD